MKRSQEEDKIRLLLRLFLGSNSPIVDFYPLFQYNSSKLTMSQIEKGYLPLSKIEGTNTEGISMSLNLPQWVDQDRIGVILRRIHQMCRMGGIRSLKIIGSTDGEVSTYTPNVVGINPDGSGIAGKAGLKTKAPLFSSSGDIRGKGPLSYSWIDAYINVNLNEIDLRISEGEDRSLRSAANWVKYLDKAVRGGIARQGVKHLISDTSALDKFHFIYGPGMTMLVISMNGRELMTPRTIIATEVVYLMYQGVDRIRFHHRTDNKQRFSLIAGPQIDRAVALKIMSQTERLVKELKR